MLIFPAIDLIDGDVVRLFQGDYDKKEKYGDNPLSFAQEFKKAGADNLHLVDLDGAKAGKPINSKTIQELAKKSDMFIELGGGIRNEQSVEKYISMGIGRIILGTSALKQPDFTKKMIKKYGEKIAVGVDARDGMVATEGWLSMSNTDSISFCKEMRDVGVSYVIYTDISRDGAGRGANIDIYEELSRIDGLNITASGGVSNISDIKALREIGIYAAIIGKALYTGDIELSQAIMIASEKIESK